MSMFDVAQAAIKRITSDPGGFTRSMTFSYPDASKFATIYGIHTKIHFAINTMGDRVNSKKAHISFSESALTDQGYVTRNAALELAIKDHFVTVIDSSGNVGRYIIIEQYPDETVGFVVCILGDVES